MSSGSADCAASQTLTLAQVASWKIESLRTPDTPLAGIPALQRGLVWKPHQIELLWDSILRGFPIGSLVVSSKVEMQHRGSQAEYSLHLLDGQQRCDAIALGHRVPNFSLPEADTSELEGHVDILWIDLHAKELPSNSTRQYLVRLTKKAHPWGYQRDDRCGLVTAHQAREASKLENFRAERAGLDRPLPAQIRPYHAELPIPLGIFLKAAKASCGQFSDALGQALSGISRDWAEAAKKHLETKEWQENCHRLWSAGRRANSTCITVLKLPDDLLRDSLQEAAGGHDMEGISNIEHLFQRLNGQGTVLSQEELAYSMIKAYLPQVADIVDAVQPLRMPPSRLVSLCVRVALSSPESDQIHRGMNISRLRAIASSRDEEGFAKITSFFRNQSSLPQYCRTLDDWLVYRASAKTGDGMRQRGIPPFLLSELALKSPDVYLLFLYWSKAVEEGSLRIDADTVEALPGVATLLHWFSFRKDLTADVLFEATRSGLSLVNLTAGLSRAVAEKFLIFPHEPELFGKQIVDFAVSGIEEADFKGWRWEALIQAEEETVRASNEEKWWHFLVRVIWNKEFVLYAQRAYLHERFRTYDQANTELWEDHNRPWDYDHILPSNLLHGRWSSTAPFKDVCSVWIHNIGNFWACPFEDNRSYGDKTLATKSEGNPDFLEDSFIDLSEVAGFDRGQAIGSDVGAAKAFCSATRSRLLRIYGEWYSSALIGKLLPDRLSGAVKS